METIWYKLHLHESSDVYDAPLNRRTNMLSQCTIVRQPAPKCLCVNILLSKLTAGCLPIVRWINMFFSFFLQCSLSVKKSNSVLSIPAAPTYSLPTAVNAWVYFHVYFNVYLILVLFVGCKVFSSNENKLSSVPNVLPSPSPVYDVSAWRLVVVVTCVWDMRAFGRSVCIKEE